MVKRRVERMTAILKSISQKDSKFIMRQMMSELPLESRTLSRQASRLSNWQQQQQRTSRYSSLPRSHYQRKIKSL